MTADVKPRPNEFRLTIACPLLVTAAQARDAGFDVPAEVPDCARYVELAGGARAFEWYSLTFEVTAQQGRSKEDVVASVNRAMQEAVVAIETAKLDAATASTPPSELFDLPKAPIVDTASERRGLRSYTVKCDTREDVRSARAEEDLRASDAKLTEEAARVAYNAYASGMRHVATALHWDALRPEERLAWIRATQALRRYDSTYGR